MELYDAIIYRKSTRKYSFESLSEEHLQAIRDFIASPERLYKNIDMKLHLVEDGRKLHAFLPGIIGGYGKVKAPYYIIVTSEEKEGYLQNIGYTLQGVVLRLTAMNLATCWLGSCPEYNVLKKVIDIPEGHIPQLMLAFGHPAEGSTPFRRNPSDVKRKDLSKITSGAMDITWSRIVSAISLAPSAANTQPWRFVFGSGKIHVYSAGASNPILRRFLGSRSLIDVGIALCHAMIAARHFSRDIRFTKDSATLVKDYEYVTTIIEV
ncbi:MAG TPA: nitroreductase family protein [Clostridia bacterium]|nr:nitroreductase family protein [Clostridia bacterium]